ncbi:MAG: hypothetical protein RMK84_14745 [Oscillochloridaceae bacterium]|nr:hypothetical protein [Chloroflexaceae bacterium]MDW8391381.1 hypothetical protein [Oscillochloridaceae bacterium]
MPVALSYRARISIPGSPAFAIRSPDLLPTRPATGGPGNDQNVIEFTTIEDDALGEELQVIWELEPGAREVAN